MSLAQLARCRAWLEPAIVHGGEAWLTWAELERRVASAEAQIWPGDASAMVTSLHRTPEGGCIHVWLAGGSLRELLVMRIGVEAWGRAQGCTHATIDGRAGWARALRACGFRRVGDELRKELA